MSLLLRSARKIRHLPILENQDFLWKVLRKPFYTILASGRQEVRISVSDQAQIWIPPEFTSLDLSDYEKEAIAALVTWAKSPGASLFIDIGSSIGVFSAVAFSVNPKINVVAIDSDIESTVAVERLCKRHKDRLKCVCGFVSNEGRSEDLHLATLSTIERKASSNAKGRVGNTRYICIEGNTDLNIPHYSIDQLFLSCAKVEKVLMKIDVEGAEMKVLEGSRDFIKQNGPSILLSVHPQAIVDYGSSVNQIREWLRDHSYKWSVLSIDHEEHWLCEPF